MTNQSELTSNYVKKYISIYVNMRNIFNNDLFNDKLPFLVAGSCLGLIDLEIG